MNPTVTFLVLLLLAPYAPNFAYGADPFTIRWQEIAALTDAKTHLILPCGRSTNTRTRRR